MKLCVSLVRAPYFLTSLLAASLAFASLADAATNTSPWSKRTYIEPQNSGSTQVSRKALDADAPRRNISPFAPDSQNLSLDLGQVFLLGDLGNKYGNSLGMQLHYNYGVSNLFAFDGALGYSSHSDGDFSMTTLRAGMRMNLSWYDKIVPHLDFGLGFYKPSIKYVLGEGNNASFTSLSPLVFGIYIGPGVDLLISQNMFFGASLTFNDLFGTQTTTPDNRPYDVGGTFTQFFLRVGMTF